jgi:phospholipid transport system substrate-binding protein
MNSKKFLIKFFLSLFLLSAFVTKSFSSEITPMNFIQDTVNNASEALGQNFSKESKIEKLKDIAKRTVDIKGLGFYTLGSHRKKLSENQKDIYINLFEKYFLKTFASRLAEYTDPKIIVVSEEKINKNYTIVNSYLVATDKRPKIEINWRVYTKNLDKPLIRDLIIEGLSLARTQKEEFNSIILSNDGNVEFLFVSLNTFINK